MERRHLRHLDRDWTWGRLAETSFEFFRTRRFKGGDRRGAGYVAANRRADGMLTSANPRSRSSYRSRMV
jgi:hypothetical protein